MEEHRHAYNFRFPPSLIESVDAVAGEGERTRWIENAMRTKLGLPPVDDDEGRQEVFGRFVCPTADCEFRADSPAATCGTHGRTVVAA